MTDLVIKLTNARRILQNDVTLRQSIASCRRVVCGGGRPDMMMKCFLHFVILIRGGLSDRGLRVQDPRFGWPLHLHGILRKVYLDRTKEGQTDGRQAGRGVGGEAPACQTESVNTTLFGT